MKQKKKKNNNSIKSQTIEYVYIFEIDVEMKNKY